MKRANEYATDKDAQFSPTGRDVQTNPPNKPPRSQMIPYFAMLFGFLLIACSVISCTIGKPKTIQISKKEKSK